MANKTTNDLNSLEVKNLLTYMIQNNLKLSSEGKVPVSIEIEGTPGTAKTSVVRQVSQKFDFHFVRLNLSEIEVCDLIGLPIYEYKIKKEGEEMWVTDKMLPYYIHSGWHVENETRTSYAKPMWIQGKEDKPIILTLDDFNRCTPMMANACMTLIDEGKYISWSLPIGSTIVLTCNPSNGDYMVLAEDSAQATRRLKINMKADVDSWASEFAEAYGVDSRCINFLLKHKEVIEGALEENGKTVAKGNLRIWTKFFDAISGIEDFSKNIDLIMNLGSGSLPMEHVILFTSFVNEGLDKIPDPKTLLDMTPDAAVSVVKSIIGEKDKKRQDLAGVITKRLLNYALVNHEKYTKDMIASYTSVMASGHLSKDLCFISARKLAAFPVFGDMIRNPEIKKMLL